MIFYIKVVFSLVAGIIAGIAGMSGVKGISFFILIFFLSATIFLTFKREAVLRLGFYRTYREAIGSSLIAFLLTWSITMSILAGKPSLYTAPTTLGPHPISFSNGTMVPSKLKPLNLTFNAVYVVKPIDDKNWKLMLGVYSSLNEKTSLELSKCNLTYFKSENAFILTSSIKLEELKEPRSRWEIEFSRKNSILLIAHEGIEKKLKEGESTSIMLEGPGLSCRVRISYIKQEVRLETSPIQLDGTSLNLTGSPFKDTIVYVCLSEGRLYAFELYFNTIRTVGFEDAYLVLKRPP